MAKRTGISNRETPQEEAQERLEHPPYDSEPDSADDAGATETANERQTSRKAGSRSSAQKAAASPYTERTMPASGKVPGAFGEEEDK